MKYKSENKIIIITVVLIINIVMSCPSFAKSKLKTKLSNFFQKIEKKLDTKTDDTASKTSNIRAQIASAPVIVASTTKELTLDDFGLLPQEQVKIDVLLTQNILKTFDTEKYSYYCCQGFTTDNEYFYIALLSKGKENEKHTKILKIRINDLKIVKEQDLGTIGHSNSLTYNPNTQKIYSAPLWKNWSCIFEFDTELENLKKVNLYDENGLVIKNKEIRAIAYNYLLDQYIVRYKGYYLAYFDSNFKIIKTVDISNLKEDKDLKKANTSQGLSTDGTNLYWVTNEFDIKKIFPNYILIFDMEGNYIDKFTLEQELYGRAELQQITFVNKKCYALSGFNGNYRIYQLNIRKANE